MLLAFQKFDTFQSFCVYGAIFRELFRPLLQANCPDDMGE